MTTDTITSNVTTGVTLRSSDGIYGNPVTVAAGVSVSGSPYGINAIDSWAIDNAGTVDGAYAGVVLNAGGSLTNEATGTILADGGTYAAVYVFSTSAFVQNAGLIQDSTGKGVQLSAQTNTLVNSGTIAGGIYGVATTGVDSTVENSGTITGGVESIEFGAGTTNRLIVDAGAVFNGVVKAIASANNTLELSAAGGAGTITGFGAQYQGFQTVTIDSGASWTVAGTIAGFNGATIGGFTADDRLDLTDLSFDAGDRIDLNSGTDVLTIRDSGNHVLGTIQLSGDFTGDFFHLVNDGSGGSFIEENTTPCYCRGTRIRTATGEVAVEALRIGDLVATAAGDALPLKWIGRRSYRDWLAVGNDDAQPILFKAGSLSAGVPARDLYVSSEHAMFIDGMLIPAGHLANGASIVKMQGVEEIDYFHLEFDRHVVIFAEGATAESFVDDDSRMLFHNAEEYRRLYPDEPCRRDAAFCAPRVEAGHALEAVRRALAARALRLQAGSGVKAQRLGYVDRATRTLVEGWAMGDEPVRLAIVVNGAVVGQTLADRTRRDLKSSGLGDCGFRFRLPRPLSPELSHRIEVRRESDWTLLTGASVTLNPTPAVRRA